MNHPNRGWRSRWSVCLDTSTSTHQDGWVFHFTLAEDDLGGWDGELIRQPEPLLPEQVEGLARIAREAGEIFQEALDARH
jgi:hypothetical protein